MNQRCLAFALLASFLGASPAYAAWATVGAACSPDGILANSNGFLTCTGGVWVANSISGSLVSGSTATTQTAGDNSTKIATTAYVDTAVASASSGFTTCATTTGTVSVPAGGNSASKVVTCTTGRTMVGGGCNLPAVYAVVLTSSIPSGNGWSCTGVNGSDYSQTLTTYLRCCY